MSVDIGEKAIEYLAKFKSITNAEIESIKDNIVTIKTDDTRWLVHLDDQFKPCGFEEDSAGATR